MLLNLNNRTIHTIKITINVKTVLDDSLIHNTLQSYKASDSVLHTELANQTIVQVVSLFAYGPGTRNIMFNFVSINHDYNKGLS